MYIDKNKALHAGALLTGVIMAIVLAVFLIAHFGSSTPDSLDGTEISETDINSQLENVLPFTVVGTWYSDCDDGDILIISEDLRYTSSAWLRDGRYQTSETTLRLIDELGGEKTLHLVPDHSSGTAALVYSDHSPVRTYYSDKETMLQNKKLGTDAAALTDDINSRNLLTILCSDIWLGESSSGAVTVDMTDSSITLTEMDTPYTFVYSLSDISFDVDSQTFNAGFSSSAKRDAQTLEGSFGYVNTISVHLDENDTYTLYFRDGNSFGFQHRPFVKTVKLSLEALPAESTSNCETSTTTPLPSSEHQSPIALTPSDAAGVAEDPDNWDKTGTKMVIDRETTTAADSTVTTTTTYADGTVETAVSHQTTVENGSIDLIPEAE